MQSFNDCIFYLICVYTFEKIWHIASFFNHHNHISTKEDTWPDTQIYLLKLQPAVFTNDYMFRAILQKDKQVLKALIAALLHLKKESIHDVAITNPIELGAAISDKDFILDIRVNLNNEQLIDLEMQMSNEYNCFGNLTSTLHNISLQLRSKKLWPAQFRGRIQRSASGSQYWILKLYIIWRSARIFRYLWTSK